MVGFVVEWNSYYVATMGLDQNNFVEVNISSSMSTIKNWGILHKITIISKHSYQRYIRYSFPEPNIMP